MATLIYVDPITKASIYQGGKADVMATETDAHSYDLIVLASRSYQPKHLFTKKGTSLLHVPFDDAQSLTDGDKKIISRIVNDAALQILPFIRAGKSILISCAAGYNRSSLITASVLMKCNPKYSNNPQEIVDLLRLRRGEHVLSNLEFVDLILSGSINSNV